MTSSNGNFFFRAIGPLCREFTGDAQRPVTRSFDVFFDLRLNKLFSKHWWGWWFEMPFRPWWHHANGIIWQIQNGILVPLWCHLFSDFYLIIFLLHRLYQMKNSLIFSDFSLHSIALCHFRCCSKECACLTHWCQGGVVKIWKGYLVFSPTSSMV